MKDYVIINVASPQRILSWTERSLPSGELVGMVTNSIWKISVWLADFFVREFLVLQKNKQCFCGKYKNSPRKKFSGSVINICSNCKVEIIDSSIRNYRMGFVELAVPILHLWYLKSTPCYLAIILGKKVKQTKNICCGDVYLKVKKVGLGYHIFTGGEAIFYKLLKINLEKFCAFFIEGFIENHFEKYLRLRTKFLNRLKLATYFLQTCTDPSWMIIRFLPILPPNMRPIVKLDDGTNIITDLNFLYIDIVRNNNKLRKYLVPEEYLFNRKSIFCSNKVDALINNDKFIENQMDPNNMRYIQYKKLKSLTESLKGKKGRFRENLLGKTVDYSGRSVIVVEPKLLLNQCGLPQDMLELFHPFIVKILMRLKVALTIRQAKNEMNKKSKFINKLLTKIVSNLYYILLNRAPTLHRLGIQAFQPTIIFEKAIQLHPLVCSAFNADFDGDQMGVHIPLSLKARAESRSLLISINNCTSPASGLPSILPSQDMVLGCYYVTLENCSLDYILTNFKVYTNIQKVKNDYEKGSFPIHAFIWLNCQDLFKSIKNITIKLKKKKHSMKKLLFFRTTMGRILFDDMVKEFL
uniref:DNA-directed RNA polymerase subunit n=1 Tax=Euglena hiemalis TaxID=392896 RepID=A0A345UC18_9EUGL|nr:RNA polymerase beta' subunit [Euglena hiemalis]AXI98004.1 RNA polymerase beta' subunit [Euglena hiemalis]